MDTPLTPLEFRLLNEWQRDFPLVVTPFKTMAAALDSDEATVLAALSRLRERGTVSRVGAVLSPKRIGASVLAAMRVPPRRLNEVAGMVSAYPEVNHNYEREHEYNLWFVATAADDTALTTTLAAIAGDTDCPVVPLPMLREYHIDLGFDLKGGGKPRVVGGGPAARALSGDERRLIAALQPGIELESRPFAALAERCGLTETEVTTCVREWIDEGLIKRFGVVVRHHELGYTANAMVVFDVPDDTVDAVGERLAGEPGVTLCYRRSRHPPEWTKNLFCMVHGRSRAEVEPVIARLRRHVGLPCEVLFSTRRFKQRGARYFNVACTT